MSNGICKLPLNVELIAKLNNWILLDFESNFCFANTIDQQKHNQDCDGFTCLYKNVIFIIYKQSIYTGRKLFTIAHEFGHIVLLHLEELNNIEYEREANMFASRILMPMCVLMECNAYTAEQISKLCGTSITAASIRAKRLAMIIRSGQFYTYKKEKLVLNQFSKFIKNNRYKNERGE